MDTEETGSGTRKEKKRQNQGVDQRQLDEAATQCPIRSFKVPLPNNFLAPSTKSFVAMPSSQEMQDGQQPTVRLGALENPFRINVNWHFPESNYPFLVEKVEQVRHHDGLRYATFDIRTTTMCIGDIDAWEARVIPGQAYSIEGRSLVLVRGPSYDANNRVMARLILLNEDGTTRTETETSRHLRMREAELRNDESRKHLHWLLVFPKGTHLDNNIYSRQQNPVLAIKRVVRRPGWAPADGFGAVVFRWVIAEASGERYYSV